MFTICVIDGSTGRPASGRKVSVEIKEGIFDFGFLPNQYTDGRGEAHFSHENARGVVYVDGRSVQEGYLSGRMVIYV
ncbi:MAG: hypothetical protein Q4F82_02970 [bacterium]|nr:hypothetical protein [bacterium]